MDDLLSEAAILLMLRAGLLDPEALITMAEEYETRAGHERIKDQAAIFTMTAHRLRLLAIDHEPPPAVDPERAHRAEFLRKRMWERGAIDGGKPKD